MRARNLLVLVPLAALPAYAALSASTAPILLPPAEALSPRAVEVARIQAHLEEVERELRDRDVSRLSEEQRRARANHIEVLREYREAGVFPHNHDFPDRRVPYFVDEHGTLCAMAYLIARSGRQDLVDRVANTRNNARIAELATDPDLVSWLEAAGLSLAEAARIQPMYGCCWYDPPVDAAGRVSARYAVASVLASGAGGMGIGMNLLALRSPDAPNWPGIVGVTAGAAGLALGLDRLADGGAAATLGAANAAVGALSASLGAWNLFRVPRDRPGPDPAVVTASRSLQIAPLLIPESPDRLGVSVRLEF